MECPARIRVWPNEHESVDVGCRLPWDDHDTQHVGTYAGPVRHFEIQLEPGVDEVIAGTIGQYGGGLAWRGLSLNAYLAMHLLSTWLELLRDAAP